MLPGIDDGARTIDDTIEIAKNSLEAGVTHIMCTPHIHFGIFDNNLDSIRKSFNVAKKALADANIDIKMSAACEVRICPEVLTLVQQGKLPYLGVWNNKKALLLELPHSHVPAGVENLIKWLLKHNIQPVIPHIERNRDVIANYSKAKHLFGLGCVFQVTAGAFIDRFGDKITSVAWKLLNDGMLCYAASDTHNINKRPNDMGLAYQEVKSRVGAEQADLLFVDVPKQITAGIKWK